MSMVLTLLIAFTLLAGSGFSGKALQEEKSELKPTEARSAIGKEMGAFTRNLPDGQSITPAEYYAKRAEVTREIMPRIQKEGLDRQEEYILALLYSWAGDEETSSAMLKDIAAGDDAVARSASKSLILNKINNEEVSVQQCIQAIEKHHERFPVSPDDTFGLFPQIRALVPRIAEEAGDEAVVTFIEHELDRLNTDFPYYAYSMMNEAEPYLTRDQSLEMYNSYLEKFEMAAEKHEATEPTEESEKQYHARVTQAWQGLIKTIESYRNQLKILNNQAPGFTFTHFFNTEPLEFSELRGKVVVLDFWANWCGPCIASFPNLRKMQNMYADKDVVILGVTGFQGSMTNHGGERVTDLSEEEELKLTEQFIEHNNVTWPVVFSTRNCYDIEYGVIGIPQMVIIDKQGVVRTFGHPSTNEEELLELIDSLLAE